MRTTRIATLFTVGLFALLPALGAAAAPRTAIVDDNCKNARAQVIDCTTQKCVSRKGKPVTACPVASASVPAPVQALPAQALPSRGMPAEPMAAAPASPEAH